MRLFTLLAIATLMLAGCTEEIEPPSDLGFDYFPLELGQRMIYQVDSIIYDTTGTGIIIDTSITYLQEEIVAELTDNTGQPLYRIEISEKKELGDPWQIRSVYAAQRTDQAAYRTEENLRFIKMIFPLERNSPWDGNRFFDATVNVVVAGETIEMFKNWEYQIIEIGEPGQVGQFVFDQITTISQADDENLIELRYSQEKYAKGIGLVYKEMRILDTQNISETLPWEEKAQKGFILRQTLIEHN